MTALLALARRHARPLLAAGMVATFAFALWARRGDLAAFDWTLDPVALAGAAALLAVPGLVQAGTWLVALRRVGAEAPWRDALRVWARSWLLRYEPSGAVGFAYRVSARERLGATTPQVVGATAYEQLAAVAGGALAAPVGFLVAGLRPPLVAIVAGGVAVVVVLALRPSLVARWIDVPLRGRTLAALVAAHAVGWSATAAGRGSSRTASARAASRRARCSAPRRWRGWRASWSRSRRAGSGSATPRWRWGWATRWGPRRRRRSRSRCASSASRASC